jgi:hypothetical protein
MSKRRKGLSFPSSTGSVINPKWQGTCHVVLKISPRFPFSSLDPSTDIYHPSRTHSPRSLCPQGAVSCAFTWPIYVTGLALPKTPPLSQMGSIRIARSLPLCTSTHNIFLRLFIEVRIHGERRAGQWNTCICYPHISYIGTCPWA